MPQILFEDNHLLVVVKPHGQPVQGDESGDRALLDELKDFLKVRDSKPGNVFLGLVHRLDRPVGGVMVFAKTSKAASRLSAQFAGRGVDKVYEATGTMKAGVALPEQGEVRQYLVKNRETNVVRVARQAEQDAQLAVTHYRVLERLPDGRVRMELHPETGRSHQLRLAMVTLGAPIVGDVKYGGEKWDRSEAIDLTAVSLSFRHPITQELLTFVV
jgi:23S rRNA pseudouridine1911/1915/1917 synthase